MTAGIYNPPDEADEYTKKSSSVRNILTTSSKLLCLRNLLPRIILIAGRCGVKKRQVKSAVDTLDIINYFTNFKKKTIYLCKYGEYPISYRMLCEMLATGD